MEEVPFEDRVVPIVEVNWDRSLWWWYPLTRAIHPAIRWTSLLVGLLGIRLLQWGLQWAEQLFSPTYETQVNTVWMSDQWNWVPRWELIGRLPDISLNNLAYFSFSAVWVALVSGTVGGVLARRSAIELGQRNMASWTQAVKISLARLGSSLWAVGMYMVALLSLLIPVLILGWVTRLGAVATIIGGVLLLTLCIPIIFAVGKTMVSLLICFPLSICAIQVEKKADAFEGFSRSNSYFFQRPAVSALLIAGFALVGEVGAFLVYWTIQLGWGMVSNSFLFAANQSTAAVEWRDLGDWLAPQLIDAFRFSYFWSATAGVYLILRRAVDNSELDDIDMLDSEVVKQIPPIPDTSQSVSSKGQSSTTEASSD